VIGFRHQVGWDDIPFREGSHCQDGIHEITFLSPASKDAPADLTGKRNKCGITMA
jgi:hypothetical protein